MFKAFQPTVNTVTPAVDLREGGLSIRELLPEEEPEVLAFLRERAEHTFGMAGFIQGNGLVSPHNRGTFFGCRDRRGHLQAVALVGHFILFDARTEESIQAIAEVAKLVTSAKMLLGEQDHVQLFWQYYNEGGQPVRLQCREFLYTIQEAPEPVTAPSALRLARIEELDLIIPAHAETALAESGEDPLEKDAAGFRARCARRIEQGQTWVWIEDGKLLFKAEVMSQTEDVAYLEGVWVNHQERRQGYGRRCLVELTGRLLQETDSVCLLVNEAFTGPQKFYEKVGYAVSGVYDTIFMKQTFN